MVSMTGSLPNYAASEEARLAGGQAEPAMRRECRIQRTGGRDQRVDAFASDCREGGVEVIGTPVFDLVNADACDFARETDVTALAKKWTVNAH